MANVQIPNLPVAISLDGTEEIEVVQSGTSRRATAQQIADLYVPTTITAAGANTEVQFNDGGFLNGNSNFTFNKTTNQIAIAAGSAAAPALIPTGDPNTGMWFPAADTIAWSTGGAERTRIDASGRFLFGADTAVLSGFQGAGFTPSFQLHGATGSAASSGLFNWSSGASSPYTITFNKSISGIVGTRGALTGGASLGNLVFNGDNGTTFSTAAAISASIDATPSPTSMPGRIEFLTTPSGSLTALERMRIRENGRVGIGTTAPDALLSVNGIASFGAGAVTTPSIAAFGDLNTGMWFPAADTVAWSTSGVERLRIDSTGVISATSSSSFLPQLLLVNTASNNFGPYWYTAKYRGAAPANAGDILGTFQFDSANSSNVGGYPAAVFRAVSNGAGATFHSGYLQFITYDLSGAFGVRMVVNEQGVQTTDGTAALPSISFINDANTGFWRPAADTIAWSTNGSERMRIDSSGSVGINRTSPATKLDVNGDIGIQYGSALCFTNAGTTLTANRAISTVFSGGLDVLQLQPSGGVNGMITFHTGSPATLRSETVRINSSGGVSIGNTTDPGVGALIVNSTIQGAQLRGGYNNTTGVANTAAQALGINTVSMVLISADTTLTSTVPPAGAHASVIIKTSGAISRTVTFGTGFKSVGTLATGATTDRFWVVNFVSDGTFLYESSRTTAAYA